MTSPDNFEATVGALMPFDLSEVFLIFLVDFAFFDNVFLLFPDSMLKDSLDQFLILFFQTLVVAIPFGIGNGRQSFLLAPEGIFSSIDIEHLFNQRLIFYEAAIEDVPYLTITFFEFFYLGNVGVGD